MKILVTGAAGFIGFHVARALLALGHTVVGLDNLNDYYAVSLKQARLAEIQNLPGFQFCKMDVADRDAMFAFFQQVEIDSVIHLAAQAGVRYSMQNPHAYVDSNLLGFVNLLECCRQHTVKHLVYASSSAVYGANRKMPFSVSDNVDHPLSLYAATKKANELLAHTYAHLYRLPVTGLRFFTVYGPWGRPDMSPFIFADKIVSGKPLELFNYGKHKRDFTYIDDVVQGVVRVLEHVPVADSCWSALHPDPASSDAPYRLYNIGGQRPVDLLRYVSLLETAFGRKAQVVGVPAQPGDMQETYADIQRLMDDTGYQPSVSIEEGVQRFAAWYKDYYGV